MSVHSANMSALQKYQEPGPVEAAAVSRFPTPVWQLLFIAWGVSILAAFLLGIFFWYAWGPRFHQMTEVMGGLSWALKSGIRGTLGSMWRMLKWGVVNLLDTNKAYETEPVVNPHFVEIDRTPPPPTEREETEFGPEVDGRLVSTPVRRNSTDRRCGVPVGNVQPKWEQVKRSRAEDEESTLDEQRVKCIKPNGGSFKTRKTRMKGSTSMAEASVMARNRSWRATARNVLKGKFYSASTSASKASKRRTIMDVAYACTEDEPVFPVTVEILVDIASVINYTEMKAGDQYLYELKLMQLENGYEWTDQLERHLQMCKRALVRDKGPDDRAVEFKPDAIEWTCLDRIIVEKGCPQSVHLSYVWASVWMLRAVEATALEVGHVVIDRHQKLVRLFIPRSKTDQKAKGVTRCLSCCRQKTCDTTCPWALATMALAKLKDLNPSAPLFPANCGKRLSQYSLVRSWAGELDGSITGHSARRSGAMMYARRNWHIQDISFLGRWKSSAVFRYVEQALEDVPVNNRAPPLQASQGVRQGGEKVVVVREKPCTETTLKVEATEAKLLEVNARLDALEKEKKSQANLPVEDRSGMLWAVSKGRSGKLRHIVKQASWNLPLQEWSTSCGWKFAKRNVKVELTRKPNHQIKQCGKCQELEELRDKVTGGVGLAQLIEV